MQGRRGVARVALEEMLAGRRILQALRRSVVVAAVEHKAGSRVPIDHVSRGMFECRCGRQTEARVSKPPFPAEGH